MLLEEEEEKLEKDELEEDGLAKKLENLFLPLNCCCRGMTTIKKIAEPNKLWGALGRFGGLAGCVSLAPRGLIGWAGVFPAGAALRRRARA